MLHDESNLPFQPCLLQLSSCPTKSTYTLCSNHVRNRLLTASCAFWPVLLVHAKVSPIEIPSPLHVSKSHPLLKPQLKRQLLPKASSPITPAPLFSGYHNSDYIPPFTKLNRVCVISPYWMINTMKDLCTFFLYQRHRINEKIQLKMCKNTNSKWQPAHKHLISPS